MGVFMYCKKCGAEIPDDSSFCFKCGTKISEEIKNSANHLEKKEIPMTGGNPVPSPSSSNVDSTHELKSAAGNNAQLSPTS